MINVQNPIWANGPRELLQHGSTLALSESEADRRIAMILIDNAVELIAKTYFTAPKRVTGLKLSRKQRDEIQENFHTLLEGLDVHAAEKFIGIPLEELEWLHGLRNHLYHQGNGLTVEDRFLKLYLRLAETLFVALFECDLELPSRSESDLLGEFLANWIQIERSLILASGADGRTGARKAAEKLHKEKKISDTQLAQLNDVLMIRNQVVHGEAEAEEILRPENMEKVERTSQFLGSIVRGMLRPI
ncbi:hypothetical protein [Tateyamaria sp.]|uniref:hypothetical protein n=1 Tax=Tateyamaria sp. TaxID=1929288 RepID=UPI00329CF9FF